MKFLDYIRGIRKGKDAQSIEHDAMSDPFLADAIEGFDSVEGKHADKIAQMQARIQARTVSDKKRSGAWKVAVAAVAIIALLSGYFALMNHQSTMVVAQAQDSGYINLYVPEGYIESKSLELTEMRETGASGKAEVTAVANIANLHEVIKPVEMMNIYIPEAYAQLRKDEVYELSSSRERRVPIQASPSQAIQQEESAIMMAEMPTPPAAIIIDETPLLSIDAVSDSATEYMIAETRSSSKERAKETAKVAAKPAGNLYLSGKVVDERNEPVIGASVVVKGTTNGVVTDIDGNYKIKVDSDNRDLIANYLGYETIVVPNAKDNQVIAMKDDRQTLSEVVVTGYGTQKRKDVTGSVAKVKSEELTKEIKPKPVIGDKEYKKYLENSLIKPTDSGCEDKKGKVVLEFNIDRNGRPVNIVVQKSLCEAFDKEAIRLVNNGPDWTYGTARVKVEVKF